MCQQSVLDHQSGDRSGAAGVEDGIVAYTEATRDEKLRAFFRQDPGLEFRIAHSFDMYLQKGARQFAEHLKSVLLIISGNHVHDRDRHNHGHDHDRRSYGLRRGRDGRSEQRGHKPVCLPGKHLLLHRHCPEHRRTG